MAVRSNNRSETSSVGRQTGERIRLRQADRGNRKRNEGVCVPLSVCVCVCDRASSFRTSDLLLNTVLAGQTLVRFQGLKNEERCVS